MLRTFAIAKRVVRDALGHFSADDGWAMASHVAMSALLASFPFLIFVTTLAAFADADVYTEPAIKLTFELLPESVAAPIAAEIETVLSVPRGGLLTLSAILALVFASNGVEALRTALNRAYRVKEYRSLFFLRAQSLVFVLIASIGMMALSFLLVLAPLIWTYAVSWLPRLDGLTESLFYWRFGVAALVLVSALYVSHTFLPASRRRFAAVWPGIVLTLAGWIGGSVVYGAYLERFAAYASTYAGLAGGVISLLYLYMLAALFIIGAEFNTSMGRYRLARFSVTPAG